MASGKGGPNYWYTEIDARLACEKALGEVRFEVTVPPHHRFILIPGKRVVAGQWISEDSEFGKGMIAHITMSITDLVLSPSKEEGKGKYHALLTVKNLHYTVRAKADSDWIEGNIKTILADQKNDPNSAFVRKYDEIQARSLHRGLVGQGWNSGNKTNNEIAKKALGDSFTQLPENLDKVKGLICTVGAVALQGKTFEYVTKKNSTQLAVYSALIEVVA
jgi:hypothetical protein